MGKQRRSRMTPTPRAMLLLRMRTMLIAIVRHIISHSTNAGDGSTYFMDD
jgi:hypothetical protein